MRAVNVFKITSGKIEYTETIKDAVLNPRLNGLKLHVNGGFDWIDVKYGFLKLLISRGQVSEIRTHSDLLSHNDYLEAMTIGRVKISVVFDVENAPVFGSRNKKQAGYASDKRMTQAQAKFTDFCGKVRMGASFKMTLELPKSETVSA